MNQNSTSYKIFLSFVLVVALACAVKSQTKLDTFVVNNINKYRVLHNKERLVYDNFEYKKALDHSKNMCKRHGIMLDKYYDNLIVDKKYIVVTENPILTDMHTENGYGITGSPYEFRYTQPFGEICAIIKFDNMYEENNEASMKVLVDVLSNSKYKRLLTSNITEQICVATYLRNDVKCIYLFVTMVVR